MVNLKPNIDRILRSLLYSLLAGDYFAVGKIDAKFIVGVKKYADKFSLVQNSNNFLIRQVFYFKKFTHLPYKEIIQGKF